MSQLKLVRRVNMTTRGVPVGLFLPVFIVHKFRPVFRRRSTKGRFLGRWQCWCLSPTCLDTCINHALILVHKDQGPVTSPCLIFSSDVLARCAVEKSVIRDLVGFMTRPF